MTVLWQLVRFDARATWLLLLLALFGAAISVPLEALLLRDLLQEATDQSLQSPRVRSLLVVFVLVIVGLCLERWVLRTAQRLGRALETRLRLGLLERLPRLADEYVQSRPSADLAGRNQALHMLRDVPALWTQAARSLSSVAAHTAALIWLQPESTGLIVSLVGGALLVPLAARRSLSEAHLRLRVHAAALDACYLDALVGACPIRVHGAECAVLDEHERRLTEWARTAHGLRARNVALVAVQQLATAALGAGLVFSYAGSHVDTAPLLLLAYWALRLSASAAELASTEHSLRGLRSAALRSVAPLEATVTSREPSSTVAPSSAGMRLVLENVTLEAGGHGILRAVSLVVGAGSSLAIVGPSGSGKSSLVGLFLGWREPVEGHVLVDGERLSPGRAAALRPQVAWVDPGVQLWAQSLYDNLTYSTDEQAASDLPGVLRAAELGEVLDQLQDGMQSDLGESGVKLSGGQGQRVRLGRAMLQRDARLVILDEPFRGLDRPRRQRLLSRVRELWPRATLLLVSHDIEETLQFERVIVMSAGRVVEDGVPERLLENERSQFSHLHATARALHTELWGSPDWQRRSLQGGRIIEGAPARTP